MRINSCREQQESKQQEQALTHTHTHTYIGRESAANLHGLLRAIHFVLARVIASGIYSDQQKTECLNHLMHGTQLILSVLCTKTYLMCSHSYT